MLLCVRDDLFRGSFADNLKLLQKYPLPDTYVIHKLANELKDPHYAAPPPPEDIDEEAQALGAEVGASKDAAMAGGSSGRSGSGSGMGALLRKSNMQLKKSMQSLKMGK